jgi:hypothetical protein
VQKSRPKICFSENRKKWNYLSKHFQVSLHSEVKKIRPEYKKNLFLKPSSSCLGQACRILSAPEQCLSHVPLLFFPARVQPQETTFSSTSRCLSYSNVLANSIYYSVTFDELYSPRGHLVFRSQSFEPGRSHKGRTGRSSAFLGTDGLSSATSRMYQIQI